MTPSVPKEGAEFLCRTDSIFDLSNEVIFYPQIRLYKLYKLVLASDKLTWSFLVFICLHIQVLDTNGFCSVWLIYVNTKAKTNTRVRG